MKLPDRAAQPSQADVVEHAAQARGATVVRCDCPVAASEPAPATDDGTSRGESAVHLTQRPLDRYVRLIARLLETPVALITIVEPERQRFLAAVGLQAPWSERGETPLSHSFCQHVVTSGSALVVHDARTHAVLSSNLAVQDLGVVSYLGVPIREQGKRIIGSLCVIDHVPRCWTAADQALLDDLAQAVEADLDARRAYADLATVTDNYRALLDTTTELVCTADESGAITFVNEAWCRAFGYSKHEACGMRAVDLVSAEHKGRFVEVGRRLQSGEPIDDFEVVALGAGNRRVVCRGRASALHETTPDGRRTCSGTRAVYRDVTRERLLESSRARLVATLEATSDFVGIAGIDGSVEYVNAAARRMLGVRDDVDVSTMSADAFHPPATLAMLAAEGFPTALRDGVWRGDGELLDADRTVIPVSIAMTAHPSLSPEQPGFFAAIMRDQREQAAAATALRTSEAKFRAMFENAAIGVSIIAPDGTILEANHAFERMLGHQPGTLIGRCAPELSPAAEAAVTADPVRALRAGLVEHVVVEKRFLHADGSIRVLSLSMSLLPLDDGTTAVLGLTTDVTDRVHAEQQLASEREFLAATLESLSDGVVACDSSGTLRLFNAATRALHGHAERPLPPEEWADTYDLYRADGTTPLPVDEIPLFRALQGETVSGAEMVVAPAQEPPRTVVSTGKPLRDVDGIITGAVVVMRDVTSERASQRALRDSDARYLHLLNLLPDGVIQHVAGRVEFANPAMARLVGASDPASLVGESVWSILNIRKRGGTMVSGVADGASGDGLPPVEEERIRRRDGSFVDCEIVAAPVQVGETSGTLAVVRDVSGRLRHERELREREAQLAIIYHHSSDVMLLLRVERNVAGMVTGYRCESVNEPLLAVRGATAADFVGKALREIVEVDRYASLSARVNDAARTGQKQQFEYTVHAINGTMIFETTLTPIRDASGRCTHVLSASRDVTARRLAEAALRESETAFRTMLQTVRAVAVTLDAEGRVTFANEALLTLTGWENADVLGNDWFPRFTTEPERLRTLFAGMIEGREVLPHYESIVVTRTGRHRLVVWDNTVLHGTDGSIVGTASIGQDVTEQRALQTRLETLSEHDELTGLLNRRGFSRRVEDAVRRSRRSERHDALLCLDLDHFKPINDTYGHAAGDSALRVISDILRASSRETDIIGRMGGDEFAIYAVGLASPADVDELVWRLHDAVAAHNITASAAGCPYALAFSVGVSPVEPADSLEALFLRADTALYAVKHRR